METNKLTRINRKTLGILILLTAATALIAFIPYIFGNKTLAFVDIGSDTSQQYLAQYAGIIEKLRTGDLSLWNENYGFGSNMYMFNMWNPLLMLLYLLGLIFGVSALPHILVFWYMGEIVLAGVAAYVYLSVFDLKEKAKGIASYIFAFNGFIIIWGQHYQFGVACILFPLLLWSIERILRDKRHWPLVVIISAVISFNSMYLAYMMFLSAALYVIFRIIMRERFRLLNLLKKGIGVALPMLLGVGIGMISILPSYEAVSAVSARLTSDLSLLGRLSGSFDSYPAVYYKTLIDRFFSGTGEGINSFDGYLNYYEAPCVFFSLLFIVLIVQYIIFLFTQKKSAKSRALQLVFLALAAAGLYFPAAGLIYNGFTAPFSRYTYLYMPYFLLISAFTLHKILKDRKLSLIGLAVSAALILWRFKAFIFSPWLNSKKLMVLIAAVAVLMLVCLLLFRLLKKENQKRIFFLAAMLCLVGTVTLETFANFTGRDTADKDGEYLSAVQNADDMAAISLIKSEDDGIYRIEKLYGATWTMDSLYESYSSISGYNSTQNRYIINYVNEYWPELYYLDQNHYSYSRSDGDVEQTDFTGIKYLLVNHDEEDQTRINEEDQTIEIPECFEFWKSTGSVDIYKNTETDSIFSFYPEDAVTEEENEEMQEVAVSYADHDTSASVEFTDGSRDDIAEGTVTVLEDGVFAAAIPYEAGWTTWVDGEQVETLLVNEGFQGVELTAGTHVVSFRYECPYFRLSAVISLISLAAFVILLILRRKRMSRLSRRS